MSSLDYTSAPFPYSMYGILEWTLFASFTPLQYGVVPFLHYTNDVPFPRDPGRKHVEWKNRNRASATNPVVASQKSIFALVSELLKCLNIDNGIWMGRQYCWHWTIAFDLQKSQCRECWDFKRCFGFEWALSIELPMSWKRESNQVSIFDIFELLRMDSCFWFAKEWEWDFELFFRLESCLWFVNVSILRMSFETTVETSSVTGPFLLFCKCLNIETHLQLSQSRRTGSTLFLILNIENGIEQNCWDWTLESPLVWNLIAGSLERGPPLIRVIPNGQSGQDYNDDDHQLSLVSSL